MLSGLLQALRGHVLHSASMWPLRLVLACAMLEGGQAKVADLSYTIGIEQNIGRLEVPAAWQCLEAVSADLWNLVRQVTSFKSSHTTSRCIQTLSQRVQGQKRYVMTIVYDWPVRSLHTGIPGAFPFSYRWH